jgi:hypothetical protein
VDLRCEATSISGFRVLTRGEDGSPPDGEISVIGIGQDAEEAVANRLRNAVRVRCEEEVSARDHVVS